MTIQEEYQLSQYEDLGILEGKEKIRLMRHKIYGTICVGKRISLGTWDVYHFLQENPCPYFPRIYECIREKGQLIVLEEYITGRTLADLLAENIFGKEETVRIALELCRGLKILHSAEPPIVYRDLKPENIMRDISGNIKMIDFDIAREVRKDRKRDTELLGSPEYAAPEQYGFLQTDNRTDIYALGVLINCMYTGKFPAEESVKGELGRIVEKCTRIDPEARYQSVDEVEEALRSLSAGESGCSGRKEDAGELGCSARESAGESGRSERENAEKSGRFGRNKDAAKPGYQIPGFRSRTPWKMVAAILGYTFVTWLCFTIQAEKAGVALTGVSLWLERIILWIFHLLFIATVCDYRGLGKRIPVLNHWNGWRKIPVYVISYFLLILLAALLCAVKDSVFP